MDYGVICQPHSSPEAYGPNLRGMRVRARPKAWRERVELERLAKRKQCMGKGDGRRGKGRAEGGGGVATLERLRGQANETS